MEEPGEMSLVARDLLQGLIVRQQTLPSYVPKIPLYLLSLKLGSSAFHWALLINRIETIRADGTGLRTVFASRNLCARDPVFSPSGNKIAFDYELGMDFWKINLDGKGLTNMTNTPGRWETSPDWGPMPTATTAR